MAAIAAAAEANAQRLAQVWGVDGTQVWGVDGATQSGSVPPPRRIFLASGGACVGAVAQRLAQV
eukprot:235480-Chlamydomonas_euryale.AAC.1